MPERRLSFILISTLLTLCLGGWILTSALERTVGEPAQAKDMLKESGLYSALIPSQLAEAQKGNPSLQGLPLDNPEVQKILGASLDTKKVEAQGDKAVDGLYSWLEGKSEKPEISLSAMPDRQALAASLGNLAAKHADTLPQCSPQESLSSDITTDPLAAKCLPIGITPETVRAYVSGEVATNPVLATETTVTEDDLQLSNGKTITDTFSAAPTWYQRAQQLPLYLAIAAAVFALSLLLILGIKQGARSVGKHLFVVGLTLAICAVLVAWAVSYLFEVLTPKDISPNLASALGRLTTLFHDAYRNNIILFSAYLAVAGAVLLAASFVARRLSRPHAQTVPQAAPASRAQTLRRTPAPSSPLAAATSAPALPATKSKKKAAPRKKAAHPRKKK